MKNTAKVALAVLMMIMIVSCLLPIAMAYPEAFHGITGSVTGKVLSSDNVPVDNAQVSIVNASNPAQVYASTTTDADGNYHFSNVNATYDSQAGDSIDNSGGLVYKIYYEKSPYGSGYVGPFGIDATSSTPHREDISLQTSLTKVTISTNKLSSVMKDDKCAKITATVYDSSGNVAPDGTMVDFYVDAAGWTTKNGSVSGEGTQYVTTATTGGKASVYYGWFPDDATPAHNKVVASVHYFSSIKASTDMYFPKTASVTPTPTATVTPTPTPTLNVTATPTPVPSSEPTSTPMPTINPTITPTITNTVEPVEQPVTAMSVLSWVVYVIVVAIGVAQIIALLVGLRVLKKKK